MSEMQLVMVGPPDTLLEFIRGFRKDEFKTGDRIVVGFSEDSPADGLENGR